MKNLRKTTIVWTIALTAVALTTALVSAHWSIDTENIEKDVNNNTIQSNFRNWMGWWNGNWAWFWRWMGWGMGMMNNMTSEDFESMNEIRNLMHSWDELTSEEFESLKEKQKEFMWFSPLEWFDSVEDFNELRSNWRGFWMMR